MNQSDVVKRIESICQEFDSRINEVGLAIARLELAKALAECEAAQLKRAADGTCTCAKVRFYPDENVTAEDCPVHSTALEGKGYETKMF